MSEVTKYRKKPVVIEARQMPEEGSGSRADMQAENHSIAEWVAGHRDYNAEDFPEYGANYLVISTLEGEMTGTSGDFIIKGVQGEFYPCKPDIFAATYEKENN